MTEHRRPNGKLAHGYFCSNCGGPTGMMGHIYDWWKNQGEYWCTANPRLVGQLRAANPPTGCKPHYVIPGVIRK